MQRSTGNSLKKTLVSSYAGFIRHLMVDMTLVEDKNFVKKKGVPKQRGNTTTQDEYQISMILAQNL